MKVSRAKLLERIVKNYNFDNIGLLEACFEASLSYITGFTKYPRKAFKVELIPILEDLTAFYYTKNEKGVGLKSESLGQNSYTLDKDEPKYIEIALKGHVRPFSYMPNRVCQIDHSKLSKEFIEGLQNGGGGRSMFYNHTFNLRRFEGLKGDFEEEKVYSKKPIQMKGKVELGEVEIIEADGERKRGDIQVFVKALGIEREDLIEYQGREYVVQSVTTVSGAGGDFHHLEIKATENKGG